MTNSADAIGRITFPGNPWPRGHPIKVFKWSGRIEASGQVWFDFHLETENYDAEEEPPDADDSASTWQSPVAWSNYHSCTISSTEWGEHSGILVGTAQSPLTFASLADRMLVGSPAEPESEYDDSHQAFGLYLLGHDGTAAHQFTFAKGKSPGRFDINWKGRIALLYTGESSLAHQFEAHLLDVVFDGFLVPDDVEDDRALDMLRSAVTDHARFALVIRDGKRWLVPQRDH